MTDRQELETLADRLFEYRKLRYAGDCKCGDCQLVPIKLINELEVTLRLAARAGEQEPVQDTHGDGYCGCTERCKDRDNCQYNVKPEHTNDQDEVLLAYGILWCTDTTDQRVHSARRELLKCLSKELQAKAISAARTTLALVRDIRQMKGATFAADFDKPDPSPASDVALREALEDCRTHRESWRKGIEIAREHARVSLPDIDDKSYWEHELRAFDRVFKALCRDPGEAKSSDGRARSFLPSGESDPAVTQDYCPSGPVQNCPACCGTGRRSGRRSLNGPACSHCDGTGKQSSDGGHGGQPYASSDAAEGVSAPNTTSGKQEGRTGIEVGASQTPGSSMSSGQTAPIIAGQAPGPSEATQVEPEALVNRIDALLDLDAKGALAPHGIGGLARELLLLCRERLSC